MRQAVSPSHRISWVKIMHEVDDLIGQEEYELALSKAQQALEMAEAILGPAHPELVVCLCVLARLYRTMNQFEQATRFYIRAYGIEARTHGSDYLNVANILDGLAAAYQAQGHNLVAEGLLRQVLAIRQTKMGASSPAVVESLCELANFYQSTCQWAKATTLSKRLLTIKRETLPLDHPDIAEILGDLAGLYARQSMHAAAEILFVRIVKLRETISGDSGDELAESIDSLASLYYCQGQYLLAEPLFRRALAIREQDLGSDHPDVGISLNNLAWLYMNQGVDSEAERLFADSLVIWEKAIGNHTLIADRLLYHARDYIIQNRHEQAEPILRRVVMIQEAALDLNSPDLAESSIDLGTIYRSIGKTALAEPLFCRALGILERKLGPVHNNVAIVLDYLASLYAVEKRYELAMAHSSRALEIRERILELNDPLITWNLVELAGFSAKQGRRVESEKYCLRALKICQSLEPRNPPIDWDLVRLAKLSERKGQLVNSNWYYLQALEICRSLDPYRPALAHLLGGLGSLYLSQKLFDKAELLLRKAMAISEKIFNPDHLSVAEYQNNLGMLYWSQNQPERAEGYFKRSLAIQRQELGSNHSRVAETLKNLAKIYRATYRNEDADKLEQRVERIGEINQALRVHRHR